MAKHQPKLRFLNIDLELHSSRGLKRLLIALRPGLFVIATGRDRTGSWARLETQRSHRSIDTCIRGIVRAIEALDAPARSDWDALTQRELCVGFDRRDDAWAPTAAISEDSVKRAARIGCSISVVVYPVDLG